MMRRHGSSIWKFTIFVMGFSAGIAMLIPMSLALSGRPQGAAATLIENTYEPATGCPGDELLYTLTWNIERPSVLVITSSHLRKGGDTIVGQRAGQRFITNIPSARVMVDDDASFSIPDLPPGNYERVITVGTESESSDPVFVVFPYTVRDDCDD